MRVQLAGVGKHYGAHVILDQVTLTIGPKARIGWSGSEFEQAQLRRKQLTTLLSTRRTETRSKGAALGDKTGGQDRRATHALETKVRQAERLLERNELPDKPVQPWELKLTLEAIALVRQGLLVATWTSRLP